MSKQPKLRGTVWQRPNGTWTVQAERTWDPTLGEFRRPSLGTFATFEEAERAWIEYNADLGRGALSLDEVALRSISLGEYLDDWMTLLTEEVAVGHIQRRTFMDYEQVVRNHIRPHLATTRIGDLTTPAIRRWLLRLQAAGLSERTVEKAYRTLHRALGDSDLTANPVRLPKRNRPRGRTTQQKAYPTPEAVRSFVDHLAVCDSARSRRVDVVLAVAAHTGLRRAELCGLAWPDLDLDAGTLAVAQTLQVAEEGGTFVKGPKSRYGYRTIGLSPTVVSKLRQHRAQQHQERLRAGDDYDPAPHGLQLVFRQDELGTPLHPDRLTAAMIREWRHTDIEPRTTLHGLRHGVGSALLLAGLPITDVASHLGDHPNTLVAHYQHELDAAERRERVGRTVEDLYG